MQMQMQNPLCGDNGESVIRTEQEAFRAEKEAFRAEKEAFRVEQEAFREDNLGQLVFKYNATLDSHEKRCEINEIILDTARQVAIANGQVAIVKAFSKTLRGITGHKFDPNLIQLSGNQPEIVKSIYKNAFGSTLKSVKGVADKNPKIYSDYLQALSELILPMEGIHALEYTGGIATGNKKYLNKDQDFMQKIQNCMEEKDVLAMVYVSITTRKCNREDLISMIQGSGWNVPDGLCGMIKFRLDVVKDFKRPNTQVIMEKFLPFLEKLYEEAGKHKPRNLGRDLKHCLNKSLPELKLKRRRLIDRLDENSRRQ